MTITTCQKVTLISCSVLCVSLFLPRMLLPKEKKEKGVLGVGPGLYRPMMHQLSSSDDPEHWDMNPSPFLAHTLEAMAKVKSGGRGKKYNLMGQVIPVYGFGILLYILYIMYKLTCNKKTNRSGGFITNANTSNKKITDYELARLQERLLQTERKLDRLVSGKSQFSSSRRRRSKTSISKKEEKLLRQLRQITLLMQDGRLEGASPEMEAEEMTYGADWEGYPEETYPKTENPCRRHKVIMTTINEPPCQQTAEALAERMEQVEEEIIARKLSTVQEEDEEDEDTEEDEGTDEEEEEEVEHLEEEIENVEQGIDEDVEEEEEEEEQAEAEKKHLLPSPKHTGEMKQERIGLEVSKELQSYREGKKQITFSDQKRVFHYPKQDTEEEEDEKEEYVEEEDEETEVEDEDEAEDDDPLMEAESLLFSCAEYSNPDEDAEEDIEEYLLSTEEDEAEIHADMPKEVGVSGLRMRSRRDT
ncbi:protein RIC-3-like isoform X2 [Oryzias latipes]|uniref:protein RIC-3-like isoform X2 n=1 Tax=Oryzias latipes TaxID=8090 RepID=UPI0009DB04C0|nr:protein RIC-3-like isoform X2 [Oryzias latipes]